MRPASSPSSQPVARPALGQASKTVAAPSLGRWQWGAWLAFALILALLPIAFGSSLALSMGTQAAYLIVICLSFNVLLGQTGLLSFGHVVYVGAGAFAAVHVLNAMGAGALPYLPVSLVPLAAGCAGGLTALVLGYLNTRRSGTVFAMISLGIGELVAAAALMFPRWFGGEGGIATDRVIGTPVWGITFGPNSEAYYLIATWCFICTALMYALTRTPLGRMFNAVRENAQRAEFIGMNAQRVRYMAFVVAGFFAGIGGGLMALHLEMVTAADAFSYERSAAYLLFTFVGGSAIFWGPIVGAVLMVLTTILLSEWTQAWKLYVGLLFVLMVMFFPGGIAQWLALQAKAMREGALRRIALPYACLLAALGLLLACCAMLLEMLYHLQLRQVLGGTVSVGGLPLNVQSPTDWGLALGALALAWVLYRVVHAWFKRAWQARQAYLLQRSAEGLV